MVSNLNILFQNGLKLPWQKKFLIFFFFSLFTPFKRFFLAPHFPKFNVQAFFLREKSWKEVVSDCNFFGHKGCKIAAHQKRFFLANFAILAGFFSGICDTIRTCVPLFFHKCIHRLGDLKQCTELCVNTPLHSLQSAYCELVTGCGGVEMFSTKLTMKS